MTAATNLLSGWLLFLTLVLSLGAVAGYWIILPRAALDEGLTSPWLRKGAARLGRMAGLLLPLAMGLIFVRQLREFRDPFVTWSEDARLLVTGTEWGTTWLWGMVGSLIALGGFSLASSGRRSGWWMATMSTLALGAFPAFTGHANGTGSLRPVTLLADTLHVWAVGGWIGGLTLMLLLERAWRRDPPGGDPSLLPALVPAFSPLAVVCVVTLVATGLVASWVHLPSVSALWSSGYGRLLTFKVLLVGAVLALGAVNWKRITPRLTEHGGPSQLRRSAAVELLIAHIVIALTAILVRTSPLGH